MNSRIPEPNIAPGVLRMSAAAQYLGIGPGLAEKLAKQGAFPLVRIGERALGVAREDLDAYIRSRRFYAGGPNAGQPAADTAPPSASTPAAA